MRKRSISLLLLALILALGLSLAGCGGQEPTPAPTEAPVEEPTEAAAEEPTEAPAEEPTEAPAEEPTEEPAEEPTEAPAAEKPEIVVAYDSDIDHIELHSFRSLAAYDATANLYEPLLTQATTENEEGEIVGTDQMIGAGAESFEVSDDGTVFTFHLREDATFADGTPITAQDYKYTYDRAMEGPGYIGALTPFMALESPDQVEVLDDYTLRITTSQPAALTEKVIGFQVFGAISQETAEENATDDDPWAFEWHRQNANSSGPMVITEWDDGVQYRFEPNPNYWQGEEFFQNSGVVVRVVPDAATRGQLLRAGDVDVALGIPYSDLDELASNPDVTIHAIPTTRVYHLGMNTEVAPFDDQRVRQAVAMAIPYDAILDSVIYGYGQQPTSPIPTGMEGHTDEFFARYAEADLAEAEALLQEAGYGDGFEVELTVPQEDQTRVDAATWVQAGLAELGINVTINAVPTAQYQELLGTHEIPMYIFEWYSWGNDPFYQLTWNFGCGQFTNYTNYCNEEIDQIIEQGTYSRDADERAELARRAQEILMEDAPWALLYQPDWVVATRSDITGIALFNDLTLRYSYLGQQ